MRLRRPVLKDLPLLLYLAGTALILGTVIAAFVMLSQRSESHPQTGSRPAVVKPRRATSTTASTAAAAAVAAFSWQAAGVLVWHFGDVDPAQLGREVRAAGFGWVAVRIADGENVTEPSPEWVSLFRAASGLPVGGWSVLRDRPAAEARLAANLLSQDGLSFYIADAEQEYARTNGPDVSVQRYERSLAFVAAFRKAEPELPAGLTSYCRPDQNDLDWAAWADGSFAFLPQAYVSALGQNGIPATCVTAARRWFPKSRVHPTVGIFGGPFPAPSPAQYSQMLAASGTVGFSLFPAETAGAEWQAFGQQIQAIRIARPPSS